MSIAGRNGGGPGAGAYATAKGGMITFTKSLAKELAPHGIRVNAVSPGVIATPFHEVFSTPEMIKNFVAAIPMGRTGTSEECATVIAFLASAAASVVPMAYGATGRLPIRKAVLVSMLPKGMSYADRFKLAKDVGFEAVECQTVKDPSEAEEIKQRLAEFLRDASSWSYPRQRR